MPTPSSRRNKQGRLLLDMRQDLWCEKRALVARPLGDVDPVALRNVLQLATGVTVPTQELSELLGRILLSKEGDLGHEVQQSRFPTRACSPRHTSLALKIPTLCAGETNEVCFVTRQGAIVFTSSRAQSAVRA